MRSRGTCGGVLPRALTALVVAFLATATALHLFFADAQTPQPDAQLTFAGSPDSDLYSEAADSAQPAPPSIMIRTDLERSAPLVRYLAQVGLDSPEARTWAYQFEQAARSDLLRKGHSIAIYKDPETGILRGLTYDLDDRVQILEANLGNGVIKTYQQPIRYTMRPVSVAFEIRDSFRKSALRNHVPDSVIESIEDAFSGRAALDNAAIGTAVKVIYEERVSRDGAHRIAGDVDAAEVRYGNHSYKAFAFRDEHGRAHLYDEEGHALGPQFLRFPVNFQYISSGFTLHRYHPILHEYRPHVGVDLAAQYGTPVKAIADGRVEVAGWCGELGNCIRIDHENATTSVYGHLSRINPATRPGSYVRIGQVIGYVGSTGLSTGPHLHFAIEKRGTFVNPLTQTLGVNHAVSPRMKTLFSNLRARYDTALAKLPNLGSRFAPPLTRKPPISALADRYHVTIVRHDRPARRRHHRARLFKTADSGDFDGGAM
jgi:murein DD-endopeptidase MepM/ murein hydrolase activator NlpD